MPKLYIVLRGEIALFLDKTSNKVRALAPGMPDHDYRIGWWSQIHSQPNLPAATQIELKGALDGGVDPASRTQTLLNVGGPRIPVDTPSYLALTLPTPSDILPGRREDTNSVQIFANNKPVDPSNIPPNPAMIAILVYDFAGPTLPVFVGSDGTTWEPEPRGDDAVIHVVASGNWPESSDHVKQAFTLAASLLGVASTISWTITDPSIPTGPPAGSPLTWDEINAAWSNSSTGGPNTADDDDPDKGAPNCGPVIPCDTCT